MNLAAPGSIARNYNQKKNYTKHENANAALVSTSYTSRDLIRKLWLVFRTNGWHRETSAIFPRASMLKSDRHFKATKNALNWNNALLQKLALNSGTSKTKQLQGRLWVFKVLKFWSLWVFKVLKFWSFFNFEVFGVLTVCLTARRYAFGCRRPCALG